MAVIDTIRPSGSSRAGSPVKSRLDAAKGDRREGRPGEEHVDAPVHDIARIPAGSRSIMNPEISSRTIP